MFTLWRQFERKLCSPTFLLFLLQRYVYDNAFSHFLHVNTVFANRACSHLSWIWGTNFESEFLFNMGTLFHKVKGLVLIDKENWPRNVCTYLFVTPFAPWHVLRSFCYVRMATIQKFLNKTSKCCWIISIPDEDLFFETYVGCTASYFV